MDNRTLNIEKVYERYSRYALFAAHWKPKEVAAVELILPDKLEEIEVLYLFAASFAYEQFKVWLHKNPERRLVFIEEDPGGIAALLDHETDLFVDPQVELEVGPFDPADLAERYPAGRIELLAAKKTPRLKKMRMELFRKTTISHSLVTERLSGYRLFDNFVQNIPHVKRAFYANRFHNAFLGKTAIICGAGPSLEAVIPLLKELEGRAVVIAGGSAVAALSKQGIVPHFGMAVDPNVEEYHRFCHDFAIECPLLFSTRLFPAVFTTCKGPFGYFRSGIGGVLELWMEETLGLTEPLLSQDLSDESLSVLTICLSFAHHLGCSTIILAGVDLAYTGGKRYTAGVCDGKKIEAVTASIDRLVRKKDKRGKFVDTAVRWVMEASAIAHFAKKHPEVRWVNAAEGGLRIEGFEEIALQKIAFPKREKIREKVSELIAAHPMPEMKRDLSQEIKESLERMIGHLEVLAGEKKGSKALAEFEMREEFVSSVLFYGMEKALYQVGKRSDDKWTLYLEIARKYMVILQPRIPAACSEASGR